MRQEGTRGTGRRSDRAWPGWPSGIARPCSAPTAPNCSAASTPSPPAPSDADHYAAFAKSLDGVRETWVAGSPGFQGAEPLPATLDALLDLHVETLRGCLEGRPAVLVGHSSGGWVAGALAQRLEELGQPAHAVVLIDTYLPLRRWTSACRNPTLLSDVPGAVSRQFVAMGAYGELFGVWTPKPLSAPVLRGNHYTLMSEHADSTTGVIHDWLTTLSVPLT